MKTLIDTALNYLGQSSTWRGIILIAGSFGIALEPQLTNQIVATAIGAVGVINLLRNSKK
jgi:hypothetical protein